jgi:hypothetical protein
MDNKNLERKWCQRAERMMYDRFDTYRILCVQRRIMMDKIMLIIRLIVERKYEISYVIFKEG